MKIESGSIANFFVKQLHVDGSIGLYGFSNSGFPKSVSWCSVSFKEFTLSIDVMEVEISLKLTDLVISSKCRAELVAQSQIDPKFLLCF